VTKNAAGKYILGFTSAAWPYADWSTHPVSIPIEAGIVTIQARDMDIVESEYRKGVPPTAKSVSNYARVMSKCHGISVPRG